MTRRQVKRPAEQIVDDRSPAEIAAQRRATVTLPPLPRIYGGGAVTYFDGRLFLDGKPIGRKSRR